MSLRTAVLVWEPDTQRWHGLIGADAVGTVWVEGRWRIVLPRTVLTLVPVT